MRCRSTTCFAALAAVVVTYAFAGCAATQTAQVHYDPVEDLTTFRSAKVLIGRVSMSSGLSSGQRVMMQVFGTCEGPDCIPSTVDLLFLNEGDRDLNLDYRRIELEFAGRSLAFEDVGRYDEPTQYAVPRGEFVRVPASLSDFEEMVSADEAAIVFGSTGTTQFELSNAQMAPLRSFLADVSAPGGIE